MKNILFILLVSFLSVSSFSCKKNPTPPVKPPVGECEEHMLRCPPPCTEEYQPVCGCNGKTYSNACFAESVGIKNYTKGACGESRIK